MSTELTPDAIMQLGFGFWIQKMGKLFHRALLSALIAVGASWAGGLRAEEAKLVQTNLVSDIPGLATITDPALKNPWGVSHSSTSPFWVSNQGTSTTTLYGVTDETNVMKVTAVNPPTGNIAIPTTAAGPQGPTGQVNNTNASSFPVGKGGDGGSAHFIFANLNGTISAWDKGPTALIQVTTPGAVYTGLAINGAQTRLYAANAVPPGGIDVFDSSFTQEHSRISFACVFNEPEHLRNAQHRCLINHQHLRAHRPLLESLKRSRLESRFA